MLHRTPTTIAGIGVAAAVAIGGVAIASMHGTSYGHAASSPSSSSGIQTTTATVNGKTETVLTNSRGLPLYYYAPDRLGQSLVSGTLAGLWPAATSSATPTARGLSGTITLVRDSHGKQLAYNGHLLYTFVSDHRDVVTGQGVEKFFVATPSLAPAVGPSTSGATNNDNNTYGAY